MPEDGYNEYYVKSDTNGWLRVHSLDSNPPGSGKIEQLEKELERTRDDLRHAKWKSHTETPEKVKKAVSDATGSESGTKPDTVKVGVALDINGSKYFKFTGYNWKFILDESVAFDQNKKKTVFNLSKSALLGEHFPDVELAAAKNDPEEKPACVNCIHDEGEKCEVKAINIHKYRYAKTISGTKCDHRVDYLDKLKAEACRSGDGGRFSASGFNPVTAGMTIPKALSKAAIKYDEVLHAYNKLSKNGPSPEAFKSQVGGDHYKKYKIQPFEYCQANNLNTGQSYVVKHITRYKDKLGLEDLKKAKHYIDLMIEMEYKDGIRDPKRDTTDDPILCDSCSKNCNCIRKEWMAIGVVDKPGKKEDCKEYKYECAKCETCKFYRDKQVECYHGDIDDDMPERYFEGKEKEPCKGWEPLEKTNSEKIVGSGMVPYPDIPEYNCVDCEKVNSSVCELARKHNVSACPYAKGLHPVKPVTVAEYGEFKDGAVYRLDDKVSGRDFLYIYETDVFIAVGGGAFSDIAKSFSDCLVLKSWRTLKDYKQNVYKQSQKPNIA
jgi:hypothetical protein